jgi:uncharacterized membrane protein YcaP (DUF421 family)
VLVLLGRAVGFVSWLHRGSERFFEGFPVILVRHGKVQEEALRAYSGFERKHAGS